MIYFASDHHFGHTNIIKFADDSGKPHRTIDGRSFTDLEEHTEYLIRQHNRTVSPSDTCYFLGDFMWKSYGKLREVTQRLNGRKFLVLGNHDNFNALEYLDAGFEDVHGCLVIKYKKHRIVLTHVPINDRWSRNIHGHLHHNVVMRDGKPDPQFINVSIEQLSQASPRSIESIL